MTAGAGEFWGPDPQRRSVVRLVIVQIQGGRGSCGHPDPGFFWIS